MSKDSLQINNTKSKNLGFKDFWQNIAFELGNARLKINPHAESIRFFLEADSDHKDFLKRLIHLSYKRCQCYHLNASFDVNVVLDVLGETCFHLQGSKEDDLLDIELLEEVAWLITQHYYDHIKMPKSMLSTETVTENALPSGSILSMSHAKIRKANLKI